MKEKIFSNENEMFKYIKDEVVAKQNVFKCYINEIKLDELANVPILTSLFASEYDVSEETIAECMESGVVASLPVEGVKKTIPAYPTSLASLSERAGLFGKTITYHPIEMNGGFKYYQDECQIIMQEGTLLAAHSNQYAYLRQDQLMQTAMLGLEEEMGCYEFIQGEYSPWMTKISWRFPEAKFTRLGITATPALQFTTNDVAKCGANLHATMEVENYIDGKKEIVSCRMGQSLSCTHKDGHTISDFKNNIEMVFSLLKDSEEKIMELREITILHPEDCFMNLVRHYNLPIKAGEKALDDFSVFRPETVNAFDLYLYLWNITMYLKAEKVPATKICDIEEIIARTAHLNAAAWQKFDVAK